MSHQLSDKDFKLYLANARSQIEGVFSISQEKNIDYGYQFQITDGGSKLTLNVYNGKKGLNPVFAGDKNLEAKVREVLGNHPVNIAAEHTERYGDANVWAGSDESGKGDYFGPLVVAAVIVDKNTFGKLSAAGVKDCKLLSDKKILELEDVILQNVVDAAVLELKPHIYNMRYEQVVAQGGKLNQLLGLGHIAALTQVLNRHPETERALIDQFTNSSENVRVLQQRFPNCKISQTPRAEADLAVAAASVLARARFLRAIKQLSERAGLGDIPKGGGEHVREYARAIVKKFGEGELRNYVKLHFANTGKISD
ncbi:MAG: ribonuclease HIII [Phascolarctobacterium sp.]|nr:ribonuclease HIII [Phascolarctobacterium sp.]